MGPNSKNWNISFYLFDAKLLLSSILVIDNHYNFWNPFQSFGLKYSTFSKFSASLPFYFISKVIKLEPFKNAYPSRGIVHDLHEFFKFLRINDVLF